MKQVFPFIYFRTMYSIINSLLSFFPSHSSLSKMQSSVFFLGKVKIRMRNVSNKGSGIYLYTQIHKMLKKKPQVLIEELYISDKLIGLLTDFSSG